MAPSPAASYVEKSVHEQLGCGHDGEVMDTSERISWEDCPICRRPAAVGWPGGQPVEFDCPRGCRPSGEQVRALGLRTVGRWSPVWRVGE
jgi:hypothetical protein